MNVLIMSDIEGASGVDDYRQIAPFWGKEKYELCINNITKDINSVINGLDKAGVENINIFDGHGNGGNLKQDKFDKKIKFVSGDIPSLTNNQYDAVFLVGQHACGGTRNGFLSHSYGMDYILKINGKYVGEISTIAWLFGNNDIPVLFVTGDDSAVREAKALLPGIESTVVKYSKSRLETKCRPVEETSKEIEEKAYNLIKDIDKYSPYRLENNIILDIEFTNTDMAKTMGNIPNFELVDSKIVQFKSENYIDIYKAIYFANYIAGTSIVPSMLGEVFNKKGPLGFIQKINIGLLYKKTMANKVKDWATQELPFPIIEY